MEFLPVEVNGNKVYAGFWKRFGASIVDMIIFIPLFIVFNYLQTISIPFAIVIVILSSALFQIYTIYFHYRYGATIGKMANDIKVTFPDGSPIGLTQVLLRSSVDICIVVFMVIAQVIAILKVDPEQYLSASWMKRPEYILPFFPVWYGIVNSCSQLWYWSEFLVLLFNKRKRALHDFIAGTVVIQKIYAEQNARPDAATAAHPPVSPNAST